MECCSKTDFGMISGRGQHAKSDGVLLQNEPPGNSQHDQHGRPEMRLFGPDRRPLPRAGGQDYVSSQANSLKLWMEWISMPMLNIRDQNVAGYIAAARSIPDTYDEASLARGDVRKVATLSFEGVCL